VTISVPRIVPSDLSVTGDRLRPQRVQDDAGAEIAEGEGAFVAERKGDIGRQHRSRPAAGERHRIGKRQSI